MRIIFCTLLGSKVTRFHECKVEKQGGAQATSSADTATPLVITATSFLRHFAVNSSLDIILVTARELLERDLLNQMCCIRDYGVMNRNLISRHPRYLCLCLCP